MLVSGSVRCPAYGNEVVSVEAELLATFQERSERPIVAEIARPEIAEEQKLGHEKFHLPFAAPPFKWDSLLAQRTIFRLEGSKWQAQKDFSPDRKLQWHFAPVNEDSNSDNFSTARQSQIQSRPHRPTSCHNIFNEQNPFAGLKDETASQHPLPVFSFSEHVFAAELPSGFKSQNDATNCRSEHNIYFLPRKSADDFGANLSHQVGSLKETELFHILVAVKPAGEQKMTGQKRPTLF